MGRRVSGWLVGIAIATSAGARAQEAPPATPSAVTAPAVPGATAPAVAEGGKIHGTVAASGGTGKNATLGIALPGVAITATNSLTGRKYTTSTDVDGKFALSIPKNGRYVVRAELAAFATGAQEIILNATQHEGTAAFTLELASRAKPVAEDTTNTQLAAVESVLNNTKGLQSLGVRNPTDTTTTEDATAAGANTTSGTTLPTLSGFDTASSDSVAISGQMGQTNGLANYSEDEVRTRINDAIRESRENGGTAMDGMNNAVSTLGGMMSGGTGGGSRGGGGSRSGSGGGGSRGGRGGMSTGGFSMSRGNFKGFNPGQIHGSAYYLAGNAALDATPFSVVGRPFKPGYRTNRYGASFTGSPYIPGLTEPNPAQLLFFNFTGQKDLSPVNLPGNVPTEAQRNGDLRGLRPIYDPVTGNRYCNGVVCAPGDPNLNIIPTASISDSAKALLAYIPMPNITAQGYNYQRIATQGTNVTQLSTRFVRNFGQNASQPGGGFFGSRGANGRRKQQNVLRQNINVGFNYQHTAADSRRIFVASDSKTSSEGYGLSAGYVIGYGRLNISSSVSWNRSHSLTTNMFTYGSVDPATDLHIPRPITFQPGFYSGVPSVSITNFSGLSGITPSDRIAQTISLNESVGWNHHKHNYRFGFNVRRTHNDIIGGNNGLGSFSFTGFTTQTYTIDPVTSKRVAVPGTGTGLADFLLGGPQQSRIQAGQFKTYLRGWIFSTYAQDDFRIRNNLTLNAGLRYEYFSPYVEKFNHLANLLPDNGFQTPDPITAEALPSGIRRSLVNPDRTMFSPRLGMAWTPTKYVKQLVVRAGYGINFNTSQYSSFANSLSYQPPYAVTQTNNAETFGCGNYATGYRTDNAFSCTNAIQNNFAVNRFYRLGRVQVINVDVQKTFPLGIVGNVGYNGSFGANLDMRRSPNRITTPGTTAQAYIYEDAVGDSRFHSLSVSARKRMSRGIAMGATYIYGHSIDNASAINGQGNNTIPQNDARLDLEYGNSTFDVRNQVSGDFVTELPFGPNRLWLTKGGFWSTALDGFSFSGNFKFASGTYYTPQFQGTSDQVASGGNYTQRPNRVIGQPINGGSGTGTLLKWFNTAAFSDIVPSVNDGSGGYGNSQRNAIQGPGIVSTNATLARSQRLGSGTKNIEARVTASNVFNTVQYSGINSVVNSPNYGRVSGAAAPRKFTFQARYRF